MPSGLQIRWSYNEAVLAVLPSIRRRPVGFWFKSRLWYPRLIVATTSWNKKRLGVSRAAGVDHTKINSDIAMYQCQSSQARFDKNLFGKTSNHHQPRSFNCSWLKIIWIKSFVLIVYFLSQISSLLCGAQCFGYYISLRSVSSPLLMDLKWRVSVVDVC